MVEDIFGLFLYVGIWVAFNAQALYLGIDIAMADHLQ